MQTNCRQESNFHMNLNHTVVSEMRQTCCHMLLENFKSTSFGDSSGSSDLLCGMLDCAMSIMSMSDRLFAGMRSIAVTDRDGVVVLRTD